MLIFRSEDHAVRFAQARGLESGESFSVATQWKVAQLWYRGRLHPTWKKRTTEESQAILESAGLTGPFWQLAP